ncbi:MAG: SAM-dependent methyltransferase [Oscillochloris sp.]|nr:SAM-dependent methyltransferase [Oscillochloris sp.]
MPLNAERARHLLRSFDLTTLFIEEIGWDRHAATVDAPACGQTYTLRAVAQKRGVIAFTCSPGVDGRIPPGPVRRAIERQVADVVREHLIVFHDAARAESIWQWVRREPGQPSLPREEPYHRDLPGTRLIQRLQDIAFDLSEEEHLRLTDVMRRMRSAFDVERVTRRFYEGFHDEQERFVTGMRGLPNLATQRWYTSVMLNRLMFTYFIQKKGLLDGDLDYLRANFERSRRRGRDHYFKGFLQPLFFEGLAKPHVARSPAIRQLLGDVPYLNGGLFQLHRIEQQYGELAIADVAFERPLDFFDRYQWHLDDRPLHDDSEINPEVLGYIFEQYINSLQKHMGAYYTKEDITGYIARSSIVPAVIDRVQARCPAAFAPGGAMWAPLQAAPDDFITHDQRKGADLVLPASITAGLADPAQRSSWNSLAPQAYALPTEIWREVVSRHERYAEVRAMLERGAIRTVNDLITWNVDLTAFARAAIATTDDPDLLLAFWESIEQLTALDPTCGSGAFLFAALNVLKPLYELCLERMAIILRERQRGGSPMSPALRTFAEVLARVAQHPNQDYFVLKSIIVNNLYGLDIMDEAVEICKLRLFLKLAAQIERDATLPNQGAEPLPDIDFNIFSGNALVGYATYDEVRQAISQTTQGQTRLQFDAALERIAAQVRVVDVQFEHFRRAQTGGEGVAPDKGAVQTALDQLDDELNRYLAGEYGIDPAHGPQFADWCASHKPFHWFIKFYRAIQQRGGFDVVIGNPPYVGYPKVKSLYTVRGYATESCANLYAFAVERSLALLREQGRYGMIVPIASVSTDGMRELQALYRGYRQWHSHWAVRPGKLFAGVDMNLTITLLQKDRAEAACYTTGYRRWSSGANGDRPHLFTTLAYTAMPDLADHANAFPKLGSPLEVRLLQRMLGHRRKLRQYTDPTGQSIYYHSGGRYWRKALPTKLSSHYKPMTVQARLAPVAFALLNSQLFYWYWIANSNCMDVVAREVLELPVFQLEQADPAEFGDLMGRLLAAYYASNRTRVRRGEHISGEELNFDVARAKPIIDEIDTLLAYHYGCSDDELDFVLNYDIKYRAGKDEG